MPDVEKKAWNSLRGLPAVHQPFRSRKSTQVEPAGLAQRRRTKRFKSERKWVRRRMSVGRVQEKLPSGSIRSKYVKSTQLTFYPATGGRDQRGIALGCLSAEERRQGTAALKVRFSSFCQISKLRLTAFPPISFGFTARGLPRGLADRCGLQRDSEGL